MDSATGVDLTTGPRLRRQRQFLLPHDTQENVHHPYRVWIPSSLSGEFHLPHDTQVNAAHPSKVSMTIS
jgi:hypothetical protein